MFPGNRKKQGLHSICVGVQHTRPTPHLRLPKNRAKSKSCLVMWTQIWQHYKKIAGVGKVPYHFPPARGDTEEEQDPLLITTTRFPCEGRQTNFSYIKRPRRLRMDRVMTMSLLKRSAVLAQTSSLRVTQHH